MDIPAKPWPTGLSERCEPLVRRVLAPNASHYTFTGTQTYIVGAADQVAVIDPGPADAAGESEPSPFKGADTNGKGHVEAILAAVGPARIAAIMCTHTHRDHSPAAAVLKAATGAPIIGCAPLTISDDGPRADSAFDHSYAPDRVLKDGERLTGPDWTIEAVATPGHTSNHLCYGLVESRALFTGDHVMAWSTSVVSPPDGDMAAYMASLDKLYDRGDTVFYPAHGPAILKTRQLVRGMLGHRRSREAQILRLLAQAPHVIPDMVAAMYKGLDPRLTGAAGRSVLAHLIDLRSRGQVSDEGEQWRVIS
ncbi:MAG: MBL fold metallo-hydrolase [Novosphingobium sp.]|uniref:MBL fold metallo-hydrolase n=1 Tax=Novosphingobium sp. TaxID=1874826 RepID=UPI0032BDE8FA